jgi:hypothetical protein
MCWRWQLFGELNQSSQMKPQGPAQPDSASAVNNVSAARTHRRIETNPMPLSGSVGWEVIVCQLPIRHDAGVPEAAARQSPHFLVFPRFVAYKPPGSRPPHPWRLAATATAARVRPFFVEENKGLEYGDGQ